MLVNKTGDSDQTGIRTSSHNFTKVPENLVFNNKIDGGYTSEFKLLTIGSAGTTHINVNTFCIFVDKK